MKGSQLYATVNSQFGRLLNAKPYSISQQQSYMQLLSPTLPRLLMMRVGLHDIINMQEYQDAGPTLEINQPNRIRSSSVSNCYVGAKEWGMCQKVGYVYDASCSFKASSSLYNRALPGILGCTSYLQSYLQL